MKTSQRGIEFIKSFEGVCLSAYKLAGEAYYTIGHGHYGPDVKAGDSLTLQQAGKLLEKDLEKFEAAVSKHVKFPLNQNQFDALVSFTYNCGEGCLRQLVGGRTVEDIPKHIIYYTNSASDKYREGLQRRRNAERDLFCEKIEEDEMVRYQRLSDIPDKFGFRGVIDTLMSAGIIGGDGSDPNGNNDIIDLSEDQVRTLVFIYRGGGFDAKLRAKGMEAAVQ